MVVSPARQPESLAEQRTSLDPSTTRASLLAGVTAPVGREDIAREQRSAARMSPYCTDCRPEPKRENGDGSRFPFLLLCTRVELYRLRSRATAGLR